MGVTTYYSVGGEIMAERSGSVRTDYARDALGSVTGTKRVSGPFSQSGLTNTYRYKPYGGLLSKTGSAPDPKFQWVGTSGYRQTSISHSASFVRARHYGQEEGRWTTVDPLWPHIPSYHYCFLNPTTSTDSTGLRLDGKSKSIEPPVRFEFEGFDNCMRFPSPPIPIPTAPPISVAITFKICPQKYDTTCCTPPVASSCVTIGASASFTLAGFRWDKDSGTNFNIDFLLHHIFGLGQGLSGTMPKKGCPEPGTHVDLEFCLRVCLVVSSLEGCVGSKGGHISSKFGFCGAPSVQLRVNVDAKFCS